MIFLAIVSILAVANFLLWLDSRHPINLFVCGWLVGMMTAKVLIMLGAG